MKLVWKILLGIFGFFILIGIIGALTEEAIREDSKEEQIIIKSPMDMLPTRDEIGTEWVIQKKEEHTINSNGFNSGAYLDIDRMEGMSLSGGYVYVYKFNAISNAEIYYKEEIKKIKEKGGYTEINPSGIDAECFAIKSGDYLAGYFKWVICKKNNIIFTSEVSSFNSWRTGYYDNLAKIIANKI